MLYTSNADDYVVCKDIRSLTPQRVTVRSVLVLGAHELSFDSLSARAVLSETVEKAYSGEAH